VREVHLDVNATGRAIHALAALRDANGDIVSAAAKLGIAEAVLLQAVSEAGPKLFQQAADGSINPTQMGLRFAEQVHAFPYVNW
jgi:hypothetical protein